MAAPKRLLPAVGKSTIMSPFSWAYLSLFFPECYDLSAPQLVPLLGPIVPTWANIYFNTQYFTGFGLLVVEGLQLSPPHHGSLRANAGDKRVKLGVIIDFQPTLGLRS